MPTYPAFIPCPHCKNVAANVTVGLERLRELLAVMPPLIDRHLLRTDADKPGPSKHLVVCQHCHYPFRATDSFIVDRIRTT